MSQINTTSSSRATTSSSSTHTTVAATRAPHRSSDNFNVQYLVLEALCPTWPSYSDMIAAASTTTSVATAPSQCDEQLMAIFTKSVPSTDAKRRQHSTDDDVAVQAEAAGTHRNLRYECSRMGVNLLMLGRWSLHEASITSKSKLQWHVTVPHPLHGARGPRVSFRVLECVPPLPPPSRAATVTSSTTATVGPASLHGARVMFPDNTSLEACVFVYPKDSSHLCVQQRRKRGSVWSVTSDELRPRSALEEENANMQKLPAASASDTDEHHNEAVEEPWVRSVQRELLQSVCWLTAATNDDAGVPSHGSCGLLVHGPSGVGKTHQLQQLLARLPDVVSVTSTGAQLQQHVLVVQANL
ncbi:Hypothetical protein, putative [Bodo saltans]|uniref:Uncharacterized protein n=1 Tax=Bodo saltans TaxID=75058 RepID=A0A0S4JBY1_BODSA|nr:Hypothetical protein, putative [Bodo saltans]|eukprot:CUG89051.1 Hypothetical protein, putative [Bodo saltans]